MTNILRARLAVRLGLIPGVLRAAIWALSTLRLVRGELSAGVARPVIAAPPSLVPEAGAGVQVLLRMAKATCLESAIVRQRWLASYGNYHDIVIGIPRSGFSRTPAHAWLDGIDSVQSSSYVELKRLAPPSAG